ncbi:TPA: hypothetical protein DIC39_03595 [Patescibacteria group bacterium]|nr:MAG: hypothetical protein UX54_C0002G0003 [Parcubacteria group bacterium GW2011_GWA2_46_39]HCU48107.1 hypothetical protein [Patescibacteria group bacterium]
MLGLVKKNNAPVPLPVEDNKTLGEIYTMPQTNAAANMPAPVAVKPPGTKSLLWLWITIGAVVLIGGGVGAYIMFSGSAEPGAPVATPPAVDNTTPPPPPTPAPEPASIVTTTPADRDRQRYLDVKNLQTALELYFTDRGSYPVSISELQLGRAGAATLSAAGFSDYPQNPIYLSQLPADPTSGQDVYYRYLSAAGVTYQIFFSLEEGIRNLAAGSHYIDSQGFDGARQPPADETDTDNEAEVSLTPPAASIDTDEDGLTDAEEVIYGADINTVDSDGDGFADGAEVDNGYDPAQGEGAKLFDAQALTKYTNTAQGFSFYYPTVWSKQSLDADDNDVIFTSATNEFIQVVVQANPEGLAPEVWYANNVPEVAVEDVPLVTIGDITAARSLNGLNIYFNLGPNIITLSYNLATHETADYLTTWNAIYKSLTLTPNE